MKTANLQAAYDGSYYTILGAGGDLAEWTTGLTNLYAERGIGEISEFFQTTGKAINEFAEARGPVAEEDHFQDDLTVLMFPLDGLDASKLAILRLMAGDDWFDDLVENMLRTYGSRIDDDEDEL